MDSKTINKWLDDLAGYFERRDTHGEDRAHWANVYNAETARKIKAALSSAEARIRELEEALRPFTSPELSYVPRDINDSETPIDDLRGLRLSDLACADAALNGEKAAREEEDGAPWL